MKKLLFVFILSLLITFTGCKSVVQDTVVEPVAQDTVVEPVAQDTVVEPAVVVEEKQIIEVSETLRNLIRRTDVMVIYYSNPEESFLNPKNESDSFLLRTPMITIQQAFIEKGFNVLDSTAEAINGYIIHFQAQVSIVKGTDNSEARAMIQAIPFKQVGTLFKEVIKDAHTDDLDDLDDLDFQDELLDFMVIQQVESKGMQEFPNTDSSLDLMQNLSAALKQSAEQIAPKLVNSLIEILFVYAEIGERYTVQLFAGESRHIRPFMRMLKRIKGVTNVKTWESSVKQLMMRINYKGTETDDFVMALDDAFYSNSGFKGYALEIDQMGNDLRLKIVSDE